MTIKPRSKSPLAALFSEYGGCDSLNLENAGESAIKSRLLNIPVLRNGKLKAALKKVLPKNRSAGIISAVRFPLDRQKALVRQGYSANGVAAYFFLESIPSK